MDQGPIPPLEVEGKRERLTHAGIAELLAPGVDEEGLHARRRVIGENFPDHPPVRDLRNVIGRHPGFRRELLVELVFPRLQRLDHDRAVAEIFDSNLVKIVAPYPHGQAAPPIVRHALIDDRTAFVHPRHAVGPTAQRRLERDTIELPVLVMGLRENRELGSNDERQLAVLGVAEGDPDPAGIEHLGACDLRENDPVIGVAMRLQRLDGEHDVLGGDRRAVMPTGLGPKVEDFPGAIGADLDARRDQPIGRIGLIERALEQGLEDEALEPLHGVTPENERIQRIVCALRGKADRAALGRLRVDIVEMGEIGPVFEIASRRVFRSAASRENALA